MSDQVFKPGDRVVTKANAEMMVLDVKPPHGTFGSVVFACSLSVSLVTIYDADELTLVSRPVYPEPGQVAVVLDAEDREVLALAVEAYRARVGAAQAFTHPNVFKLNAILGRAREAIPA